jgi:hypothetical protein
MRWLVSYLRAAKIIRKHLIAEVDKQIFFKVHKSQIRKFVGSFRKFIWCACPQIANPQIFFMIIRKSQIRKVLG